MVFVATPTRTWNRNTPGDGDLVNPEIQRIYNNLNHLKDGQDNPVVNFTQLNDAPSSYTGKKGMLPVVNADEDGLDFVDHFGLLDYKWSGRKFSPSPLEPWFRADLDHTLLLENWPLLVPQLRNTKIEFGSASIFNVIGFSTGTTTRLQLEDTLVARNLMRALLGDYRFSKSYNATTNADGTDDDTAFSNWAYIVRITTDIGTGDNAPKAGQEFRIRYLTSLAETLSVTNRYIRIDKDTSSLATTGTGTIEIFPYRIASGGTPTTNSAKWRKIGEAGLMTPGATFYSGTDLMEVPANVRVEDRSQGHWKELAFSSDVSDGNSSTVSSANAISTRSQASAAQLHTTRSQNAVNIVRDSVTNELDGAPRVGPNTRERNGVALLYGNGKVFVV